MPPINRFPDMSTRLGAAFTRSWAVTPDDAVYLDELPRLVTCTGEGVIAWENEDGEAQVTPIGAYQVHVMRPARILATGTTATGIHAMA